MLSWFFLYRVQTFKYLEKENEIKEMNNESKKKQFKP